MRKLSIMLLAAATVLIASCQQDIKDTKRKGSGGEATLTISTAIPGGSIKTYGSGDGGATNLAGSGQYDLRYTLEVYSYSTFTLVHREVQTTNDFGATMHFALKLPEDEYQLMFWADFVPQGTEDDLFYDASDLRKVKLIQGASKYAINQEARDAYYAVETVDLIADQTINDIVLKRPFGKIRFIATDRVSDYSLPVPDSVKVNYNNAQVPATFSVGRKEFSLPAEYISLGEYAVKAEQTFDDVVIGSKNYGNPCSVLAYDYIFPDPATPTVPVIVRTYDDTKELLGTKNISAVPIAENKLTTVIGNFYTGDFKLDIFVTADDAFHDDVTHGDVVVNIIPTLIPAGGGTYLIAKKEGSEIFVLKDGNDYEAPEPTWCEVEPMYIVAPNGNYVRMVKITVDQNSGGLRLCSVFIGTADAENPGWPDLTQPFVAHKIKQEAAALGTDGIYNEIDAALFEAPAERNSGVIYTSPLLSFESNNGDETTEAPDGAGGTPLGKTVNLKFTPDGTYHIRSIGIKVTGITPTSLLLKSDDAPAGYDDDKVWLWNNDEATTEFDMWNSDPEDFHDYDATTNVLPLEEYYLSIGIPAGADATKFRVKIEIYYEND